MSSSGEHVPEWMKKFQEIGQKSQKSSDGSAEEAVDNSTVSSLTKPAGDASATTATNDEDAAALFMKAGTEPAKRTSTQDDASGEAAGIQSNGGPSTETSDDAAALFHSAGQAAPEESSTTTGSVLDESKASGDDAAALFHAAGATNVSALDDEDVEEEIIVDDDGEEVLEEEIIVDDDDGYVEEEMIEEYVDEDGNVVEEIPIDADGVQPSRHVSELDQQGGDPPGGDVENQKNILADDEGTEIEEMNYPIKRKPYKPMLGYAACIAVSAAVVLILILVVFDVDKQEEVPREMEPSPIPPTEAPTPAPIPPLGGEGGGSNVAATTEFAPLLSPSDCDFSEIMQPHVEDQCRCAGEVFIVQEDIRKRWEGLMEDFIPTVGGFDGGITSCEPRNQALLWLSTGINNGGEDEVARRQRFALAELFYSNGGRRWDDASEWLGVKSVCTWAGITCNSEKRVTDVDMEDNGLVGELSTGLGALLDMKSFNAKNNAMTGPIPPSLLGIKGINVVDLSDNSFYGSIPPISRTLQTLILERNNLSGEFGIDGAFDGALSLRDLRVGSNAFNGQLPVALFSTPVENLDIGSNFMTGAIPPEIGNLSKIVSMRLGPNSFNGDLPSTISQLTSLARLDIQEVPDLEGRLLGTFFLSLTNLAQLTISQTSVRGNLPTFVGEMTKLETIDLSQNAMRSEIPVEIGQLSLLRKCTTLLSYKSLELLYLETCMLTVCVFLLYRIFKAQW